MKLKKLLMMAAGGNAPTYSEQILSLGPIAYWPLNETSGSAAVNLVSTGLNGAYTGCTLGQAQAPFVAPAFDGSTSYCNIYSAALNTAWNRTETSCAIWCKVSGSGVWTDGVARRMMQMITNPFSEGYFIRNSTGANTLYVAHFLGGSGETVSPAPISTTGWFHLAITASKTADEVKVYYNGAQNGSTQTGLGVSAGNNLLNTSCCIGSENTTPGNVWSGWLAHAAIWNRPLTPTEVANLYAWGL